MSSYDHVGGIRTSQADTHYNSIPMCLEPGQRSLYVLVAMTPHMTQWLLVLQSPVPYDNEHVVIVLAPSLLHNQWGDHNGFCSDQQGVIRGVCWHPCTSCNHGTHIGLTPHTAGIGKFLYHFLGHCPFQHCSA